MSEYRGKPIGRNTPLEESAIEAHIEPQKLTVDMIIAARDAVAAYSKQLRENPPPLMMSEYAENSALKVITSDQIHSIARSMGYNGYKVYKDKLP